MEDNVVNNISIEDKINEWIKRGEKIIYPENFEDWKNCVKNRANDYYKGADLECALEIMEALENDANLYELEEKLNRASFSESAHYLILRIILSFSKQGPELMEYITHGDTPDDLRQAIESQKKENEKLAKANVSSTITNPVVESTESTINTANTEYEPMDVNVSLQVVKKQSIFAKIINFIKNLFRPKHKLLGTSDDSIN